MTTNTGETSAPVVAANAAPVAPVVPAAPAPVGNGGTSEGVTPEVPAAGVTDPPVSPADGLGGDPAPEVPAGAPEAYADFTLPDGFVLEPELGSAFSEAAKAANLSQEQAQSFVDFGQKLVERTLQGFQEQSAQQVVQWAETAKADPEVGGPNYEANVQVAQSVVAKFGTPALKQAFNELGLGNHPELVRVFTRIGKAMAEGGFVHGQGQEQPAKPVNRADALVERIAKEQARGK